MKTHRFFDDYGGVWRLMYQRTAIPVLKGLESQKQESEVDKLAHIAQWDVFQKDNVSVHTVHAFIHWI